MSGEDPRRFLYRSLDPDEAVRLADRHLSGCDDGELYLQYSANEAFVFDDGRLRTADYNTSSGFGLGGRTDKVRPACRATGLPLCPGHA